MENIQSKITRIELIETLIAWNFNQKFGFSVAIVEIYLLVFPFHFEVIANGYGHTKISKLIECESMCW